MFDSEIVAHVAGELGPASEHYEGPQHRVSHFGELDCGWQRVDSVPPCFHFSVLSVNFDGTHRTSELVLSQRFEVPVDFASLKAKIVENYGEPDYASDPRPFELGRGWHKGQYLWSDEFSKTSESDIDAILGALFLRDAKGVGSGVWLRVRLHQTDAGKVIGMEVELGDQTLNAQRGPRAAALRQKEREEKEKQTLEVIRLK